MVCFLLYIDDSDFFFGRFGFLRHFLFLDGLSLDLHDFDLLLNILDVLLNLFDFGLPWLVGLLPLFDTELRVG